MKSLHYIFLIVLLNSLLFSQSGWTTQLGGGGAYYPYYPYNRDIYFINSQTGWLLFTSHIKHTTNGGADWKDYGIELYQVTPFNLCFTDDRTGWIAGGRIIKTTNSGQTWFFCDTTVNVKSVHFINSLTGWACGNNGKLFKSTNGGLNWDSVHTGVFDNMNCVYFTNEQSGFVAADWGKILRTTNAGINWTFFYDNITYSFFQTVKFTDNNSGIALGSGGNIFMTHDGGANWVRSYYLNYTNFTDVTFYDSQNWFTCAYNGEVYRTTNSGYNWTKTQSSGLHSNNFCIQSAGLNNLWLAADSGTIYKSTNYAQSWNELFRFVLTNANFNSINFINQITGYCCGDYGLILKTTNSGTNWQVIRRDTNLSLSAIVFMNQSTGITAGGDMQNRNVILKTTNEGLSWAPVFSDTNGSINAAFFLSSQIGWCTGNKGLVLKTTNSGSSWFRIAGLPVTENENDIEFININTGFITRTQGSFYKTTNGGQNWTLIGQPGTSRGSIHFVNQLVGFISGTTPANTVILKTTDSGNNWNLSILYQVRSNSIFFLNESKGWLGQYYRISHSSNGGTNWIQQHYNGSVLYNDIYFINEFDGWACGSYGTIVHTTSGGIGIKKIESEIPANFVLHQNYPNPFNPTTKIRFEVPVHRESGNLKLEMKVYDILGREITTLLNQPLQPGIYEVDFDGSNYASGIYFYNLKYGEYFESRKMIILK
jgi:photosystem II stability/assembly factor-like uncharacterized protein